MILAITFLVLGIAAYSISQAAQHGRLGRSFSRKTGRATFWGECAWMRKYKNDETEDGPAFPGSTTFLVFLTDGYHLCQAIAMLSLSLSFGFLIGEGWKGITLYSAGAWAIIHTVHYLTYRFLSK